MSIVFSPPDRQSPRFSSFSPRGRPPPLAICNATTRIDKVDKSGYLPTQKNGREQRIGI